LERNVLDTEITLMRNTLYWPWVRSTWHVRPGTSEKCTGYKRKTNNEPANPFLLLQIYASKNIRYRSEKGIFQEILSIDMLILRIETGWQITITFSLPAILNNHWGKNFKNSLHFKSSEWNFKYTLFGVMKFSFLLDVQWGMTHPDPV
jgi:hypothetical protein